MTTTTAPPAPLSYNSRSPRGFRQRVNWRMVIFLAAITAPFLYILYVFLSQTLNHGVIDRGGYAEVELKALGNFPFNQDAGTENDIPKHYRQLDGKRVLLKGFMWAPRATQKTGKGTEVQFVYNVNKCCFSGPPLVQERVYAFLPAGSKAEVYDPQTFVGLTGTLHVRLRRDESGAITSVYDMDVESAEVLSGATAG